GIDHHLVHTGQNYDERLSQIFFDELDLPEPDAFLGVREQTVGAQIGKIIALSERELLEARPDALLILGDTNSGLAAIAAARHDVPIFHMEAGNRCFDWRVPEEKNRRLIDHISDRLLPYTARSREYLLREGIDPDRIHVSGNPIRDVLEHFRGQWESSDVLERLGLGAGGYVLATVHRQESVDVPDRLRSICAGLSLLAATLDLPVVWSLHPRTREKLGALESKLDRRVRLEQPFGFFDFVRLEAGAALAVTDSGTVQEECSLLGTPTVTCRETTERPETVECGSNVLSGVLEPEKLVQCAEVMLAVDYDWTSPYAGPEHQGVADKVVRLLAGV
ncbi:MAG TPA: UDP-N-acetylglucosamine 2-epimerase (non-hydrolyzing), partial [Thermoleophilaceae bacterium]